MMDLRIGHLSTLYHTSMLFLAMPSLLRGFRAQLRWRLFGTGPAIVQALGRGELDLAYIGLPPAIKGMAEGVRIKCVAGGHVEGTVIAGRADAPAWPGTENLGEILSGPKEIGVPGAGSIHDIILRDSLRKFSIKAGVRNFPWAEMALEAFVRREVDAVCGTPALAHSVRHFAGGKILYPPHLLWPDNPSYGIVATLEFLERRREPLKEFLALHEEAETLLRERPEEISAEIARYLGVVDRDFVRETIAISPRYCAALSPGFVRCTMALQERMAALGYIPAPLPEGAVFDYGLIREVHPGPPHYGAKP